MGYDNEVHVISLGGSTIEQPKEESIWKSIDISEEEIERQLDERPGGRKAGRGDSPFSQECYEGLCGLKGRTRKDDEAEGSQ